MDHNANYYHWLTNANAEIVEELRSYSEKDIEDSFYKICPLVPVVCVAPLVQALIV